MDLCDLLFESDIRPTTDEYVTLNQVYDGDWPADNELLWEFVSEDDMDVPFKVIVLNPVEWFVTYKPDGTTTMDVVYKQHATKGQKKFVQSLMSQAAHIATSQYLVVDDMTLVDGFHRLTAMALVGITKAQAVDLSEPLEPV